MTRVLVTGGAGYIGSVLVPELLLLGYEVNVIDNFMFGQNSLALSVMSPRLQITVGDVRNTRLIKENLSKSDVVVPLAAIVGAPACARDETAAESTNLRAPLDLFSMLGRSQRIIMPTTNSAYGTTPEGQVCTEESPLNPISLYAQHKVEVEKALMENELATSFRLATVFGMSPRMRLDLLVNDLTYRAIFDRSVVLFESDFMRNYVHIRDVSRAIAWAIENPGLAANQVFNVGLSSANLSKRQLCERIALQVPGFTFAEADTGKDPDQRNYTVSNDKIEKAGFAFNVGLDQGITELVKGLATLRARRYVNV